MMTTILRGKDERDSVLLVDRENHGEDRFRSLLLLRYSRHVARKSERPFAA